MTEMFELLKELTTNRAPEKVLMREEAKQPVTKNVNSISLIRGEEEENDDDDATTGDSIEKPDGSDAEMPLKEAEKENEAKNETKKEPIKSAEKELTQAEEEKAVKKLTNERPAEMDIRLSLASHSYIYPLGIAEDVLVDVVGYVYPVDFVILDIKEDEKRPFILGTPFLTTAKAVIKFDKGTVTLRSGKSKMSFRRIHESLCKIEKGIKNDIEPIAPTMTVNGLVLEWEERIKLHQEKEMKFDQWRSKTFKNKHPTLVKVKIEMNDEGEVTARLSSSKKKDHYWDDVCDQVYHVSFLSRMLGHWVQFMQILMFLRWLITLEEQEEDDEEELTTSSGMNLQLGNESPRAGSGECLSKKEIISNFLQGTVISHNERFGDDETGVAESSANEIESVVYARALMLKDVEELVDGVKVTKGAKITNGRRHSKESGISLKRYSEVTKVLKRIISLTRKNPITQEELIDTFTDNDGHERSWPALLRLAIDDVLDSWKPKENLVIRQRTIIGSITPEFKPSITTHSTDHVKYPVATHPISKPDEVIVIDSDASFK
ncbi:reverse transcriptase domain-containing protein [Tanacetum coccineum]